MATSLKNFRDFGGYRTENGKIIKKGMLYRSDALCNLTLEEQKLLSEDFQIKLIIDFRSEGERLSEPDKLVEGAKNIAITPKAKLAETASESIGKKKQKRKTSIEQIQSGKTEQFQNMEDKMMKMMRSFVSEPENREAYSQMLHQYLLAENYPILQHCRGGKDRTGFGSALILGILGVPIETIYEDYLLSNKCMSSEIACKMDLYQKITNDKILLENLRSMLEVRKSYLDHAFDEINQQYGDFSGFITEGLSFSEEKQKKLQGFLLE